MVSKYVQDIRKIVGIDVSKSSLGNASLKARIDARRGVGFFDTGGQTSSSSRGVAGQSTSSTPNQGTVQNPAFDAGNYVDVSSPSGGQYDYNEGSIEADDNLMNNLPDLNDGSNLSETLNGILGLRDPVSDRLIDLRFDGRSRPPQDWINDSTPLSGAERWTSGTFWSSPASVTQLGGTPIGAAKAARNLVHSDYTTLISTTSEPFSAGGSTIRWIFEWENASQDIVSYYAQDQSCIVSPNAVCSIINPVQYSPDDRMQLVAVAGKWAVSQYESDEDIINSFTDNQHSRIDANYGTGKTMAAVPTANGGYIIGETVGTGGAFLNDNNRVFNSFGKVTGYVTKDMIQFYLP